MEDGEGNRSKYLYALEQALRYEDAVTPIVTTARRFAPRLAQAVEARPVDGVEDEIVDGEERRGYLADDAVLRPAHIIVANQP